MNVDSELTSTLNYRLETSMSIHPSYSVVSEGDVKGDIAIELVSKLNGTSNVAEDSSNKIYKYEKISIIYLDLLNLINFENGV